TYPVAWLLVIGTLYLLPDAVAYLAWELRENWRLYRANRGKAVGPAAIGAHGETVRGLLQPGFHSGTVPRLYARLRPAGRRGGRCRRATGTGRGRTGTRSRRWRPACSSSSTARC